MSVGVCGTMRCMRRGDANNMSQAAYRYAPFPAFFFPVKLLNVKVCASAAQRAVVWIGRVKKKKNNRRENVWKKNDERFSPNEQDTKLGCSVAMATPARQLAFFRRRLCYHL